jgi:transposase
MREYYVGLDVHSRESAFVIQDATGAVVARGTVATTPAGLQAWRAAHALPAGTRVALESGTVAFPVARVLTALGLAPEVCDAYEVRRKTTRPRQKSDQRDAFELADGLRRNQFCTRVLVPSEAITTLRAELSRRRHFVRLRTAEVVAAKHLCRAAGYGHIVPRSLRGTRAWQRVLQRADLPPALARHLALHARAWTCAAEQVRALDATLAEQATGFGRPIALLQTIPRVGPVIALTVFAAYVDVRRFPTAKHAASYVGLVPTTYQSGTQDRHGHITKAGSAEVRAMLCEAAQHAARPDHPLRPFFAAVCARAGYKRAIIAVAHRLARIAFALLRDDVPFDLAKAGVEVGPFERRITQPYRRATRR